MIARTNTFLTGAIVGAIVTFLILIGHPFAEPMSHTANVSVTEPAMQAKYVRQAKYLTRPCKHEDSLNCHWYADYQGNGQGASFIAVRVTRHIGCVQYLSPGWEQESYCIRVSDFSHDGGWRKIHHNAENEIAAYVAGPHS